MEQPALFQNGTLGSLMAGLYDGTMTIDELIKHGDLGIGTLDALDGELIVLDGKAYQAREDNQIIELKGEDTVPYAAVIPFQADETYTVSAPMDAEETKSQMEKMFLSQNIFQAVKVTGLFRKMHVRVVPRQTKPYPKMVEVAQQQPEFEKEMVEGTLLGFYTPELFQGTAAAGFHVHFLDDAHQFGGHVLDYVLEKGTIEVQFIADLQQHFQTKNETFLKTVFTQEELAQEIELAES